MASLTTTQIALLAAAAVVAMLLFGPKIKDGLAAAWAKITGGDVAGGVQTLLDAIKNSDLVQKGAEIKGTAGNIVVYAEVKALANRIVRVVDASKLPEVEAACQTLLTAVATAPVVDEPAAK